MKEIKIKTQSSPTSTFRAFASKNDLGMSGSSFIFPNTTASVNKVLIGPNSSGFTIKLSSDRRVNNDFKATLQKILEAYPYTNCSDGRANVTEDRKVMDMVG